VNPIRNPTCLMSLRICSLAIVAALSVLLCEAQTPQSRPGVVLPVGQQAILNKEIIERHFESNRPVPRPQLNGVTPGAHLLDQARRRSTQLSSRAALKSAGPTSNIAPGAALPGIQLRPELPAGSIPTAVVTGDFDRDGHMDFVIANGATSDLWMYLGKGDGTFHDPRVIPLSKGLAPVYLAAGDFRGNGVLDLAIAEGDTNTVGVILGNGDGSFGYEQIFQLPQPAAAVVIDDFNHDGKPDIAALMITAIGPDTMTVPYVGLMIGDGTGHFADPVITSNPGFFSTAWNMTSGDVNGDGLPDLLIVGPGLENSQIYLNNGDGTFIPGQIIIQNTAALDGRLADINGDGCLDAVIADAASYVWVSIGDCKGNFTAPKFFTSGDSNAALRLADVNGDGHLDIITSSIVALNPLLGTLAGNSATVSFGDGKGNFSTSRSYIGSGQAYSIGVADFNGDGKLDFVTASGDTDSASLYLNDGAGSFGFPQGIFAGVPGQVTVDALISSVSFADLNGDGKMDAFLLAEGPASADYSVALLNDGSARFNEPKVSDIGLDFILEPFGDYRLGDFRNTGHQDLVMIGQDVAFTISAQYIFFAPGNGDGTFATGKLVATTGADGLMTTGDFNHDGKLDIVTVNGDSSHTLTAYLGNGDGTFVSGVPLAFSDSVIASRIYTSDFNHDGKLDVLVFDTGNGYYLNSSTVWEFDGNGDGTFQTGKQLFTDFQPFALADLNGDKKFDIARYDFMWADGISSVSGPVQFTNYLGQSDGTFTKSSSYEPYAGTPTSVAPFEQKGDPLASSIVADYNADGKPEEVAFQSLNGQSYAQFLLGNGDGTFTPTYDVFPFYIYDHPLYAYDLDGDGYADMLEVDVGTSGMHVVKGARAPALQIALKESVATGSKGCGWVFPNLASGSVRTATLSSSVSGVVLPGSVSIPANAISASFCYSLEPGFDWRNVFDINAQLDGDTATVYASDSYVFGFSETVEPTTLPTIYAGQSTQPLTVSVASSQGYRSTVRLSCEGMPAGDTCTFGTTSLDVSPDSIASTTVVFNTVPQPGNQGNNPMFTVVSDDGNIIRRQTIGIYAATLLIESDSTVIQTASPGSTTLDASVYGLPPYTFNCSGLPAGASCTFTGKQESFPSISNIAIEVNVPAGTAASNFPFHINVASQSYAATLDQTLQVVGYSVQGPSTAAGQVIVGSTQNIPITITGSADGTGVGDLTISCSVDSSATCTGGSVVLSQSSQTFYLTVSIPSGTATGVHQLTVTSVFQGLTQTSTFPITVVDFSGTLSTTTLSMSRGASTTLTATLTGTSGFSHAISIGCSVATQNILCSVSPLSVQLMSGTPEMVKVTLTATSLAEFRVTPRSGLGRGLMTLAILFPLGFAFCARRYRSVLLGCLLGALLCVSVTSCGSGSSAGSGGGGGSGSNTYQISIVATAIGTSATRPVGTISVTVNH
jgi:hypothetical protein